MRSEMPQPERELWIALRAKRFAGVKFSRQVVIGPYIVDFVARSSHLIIEVDGDSHAGDGAHDARRSAWLEQQGYRVIRFNNSDVIGNLESVLGMIGGGHGAYIGGIHRFAARLDGQFDLLAGAFDVDASRGHAFAAENGFPADGLSGADFSKLCEEVQRTMSAVGNNLGVFNAG